MVELVVEFEFFCAECGEGICRIAEQYSSYRGKQQRIDVGICPKCHDSIRGEGYDEGYEKGYEEAKGKFDKEEL